MTIRSVVELEARFDDIFSFSKKEIFSIKKQLVGKDNSFASRAAAVFCYAHWEGTIKYAFWALVDLLTHKKLKLSELAECYLLFAMANTSLRNPPNGVFASHATSLALRGILDRRISPRMFPEDQKVGSLDWQIFCLYAPCICVDVASLISRRLFIDEKLVPYRHSVAHGKRIDKEFDSSNAGIDSYCTEVIDLLDALKAEILNGVQQENYLRK